MARRMRDAESGAGSRGAKTDAPTTAGRPAPLSVPSPASQFVLGPSDPRVPPAAAAGRAPSAGHRRRRARASTPAARAPRRGDADAQPLRPGRRPGHARPRRPGRPAVLLHGRLPDLRGQRRPAAPAVPPPGDLPGRSRGGRPLGVQGGRRGPDRRAVPPPAVPRRRGLPPGRPPDPAPRGGGDPGPGGGQAAGRGGDDRLDRARRPEVPVPGRPRPVARVPRPHGPAGATADLAACATTGPWSSGSTGSPRRS